jgi:hypothetical protein
MTYRNFAYALNIMAFSIILGAAIYEHVAVWPYAFAAPRRSLTMFQGDYPLNSSYFWIYIHPVAVLLFTINLAIHWKTPRRKSILVPMLVYVLILAITFSYFVPELMSITGTPYSDNISADLQSRGSRWIALSLVRAGVLMIILVVLILGMSKPGSRSQTT